MSTNTKSNPASNPDGKKRPLIFIPPEKRCAHHTQQGAPCRAARWRASRFCIFHDPNFRKLRKHLDKRRKLAAQQTPLRTPEGIHKMLEDAAQDVREKRLSTSEAGMIGYLAQVMISNLKNLPRTEDANTPSREYVDSLANDWVQVLLDNVNEEIARWIPDSSPMAVAQAERDVVKIAADASAAEARAAALASAPAASAADPVAAQRPYTWKKDVYDP